MTTSKIPYLRRRLRQRFRDDAPDYVAARLAELRLLEAQGASSLDDLVRLAEDSRAEPQVRALACWHLGRLCPKKICGKRLAGLLSDPLPAVRREAARSLGVLGDRTALPVLTDVALHDDDLTVRAMTLDALALLGGRGGANGLLAILLAEREPIELRGAAAEHLGHVGFRSRDVVVGLVSTLTKSPELAFWSVHALGLLGARAALPALRQVRESDQRTLHPHGRIRDEATRAIEQIEAAQAGSSRA